MSGGNGGRFAKGKSGNPKGRPRKPKTPAVSSAFDLIIDRTLTITQNGHPREVTVEEALQHKTYQEAVAGSRSARREILKMIAKREQALAARLPIKAKPVQTKIESVDPDNADEALLILRIASLDPRSQEPDRRILLQPWAVEAALNRSRTLSLRQKDVDDIRRSVLDPEKVRGLVANEQ